MSESERPLRPEAVTSRGPEGVTPRGPEVVTPRGPEIEATITRDGIPEADATLPLSAGSSTSAIMAMADRLGTSDHGAQEQGEVEAERVDGLENTRGRGACDGRASEEISDSEIKLTEQSEDAQQHEEVYCSEDKSPNNLCPTEDKSPSNLSPKEDKSPNNLSPTEDKSPNNLGSAEDYDHLGDSYQLDDSLHTEETLQMGNFCVSASEVPFGSDFR